MICGRVNGKQEAVVSIRLRGLSGIEVALDAVIDTGFTDALTLSDESIEALGLQKYQLASYVILADGSSRACDIYSVELFWDAAWQTVIVSAVGIETLLGMRLLAQQSLRIDVVPGGLIEIAPLL